MPYYVLYNTDGTIRGRINSHYPEYYPGLKMEITAAVYESEPELNMRVDMETGELVPIE